MRGWGQIYAHTHIVSPPLHSLSPPLMEYLSYLLNSLSPSPSPHHPTPPPSSSHSRQRRHEPPRSLLASRAAPLCALSSPPSSLLSLSCSAGSRGKKCRQRRASQVIEKSEGLLKSRRDPSSTICEARKASGASNTACFCLLFLPLRAEAQV